MGRHSRNNATIPNCTLKCFQPEKCCSLRRASGVRRPASAGRPGCGLRIKWGLRARLVDPAVASKLNGSGLQNSLLCRRSAAVAAAVTFLLELHLDPLLPVCEERRCNMVQVLLLSPCKYRCRCARNAAAAGCRPSTAALSGVRDEAARSDGQWSSCSKVRDEAARSHDGRSSCSSVRTHAAKCDVARRYCPRRIGDISERYPDGPWSWSQVSPNVAVTICDDDRRSPRLRNSRSMSDERRSPRLRNSRFRRRRRNFLRRSHRNSKRLRWHPELQGQRVGYSVAHVERRYQRLRNSKVRGLATRSHMWPRSNSMFNWSTAWSPHRR